MFPPVDSRAILLISDGGEKQVYVTVIVDVGGGAEASTTGQDPASFGIELPVLIGHVDVGGVRPVGVGGVDEYQVQGTVTVEVAGLDPSCLRGGQLRT